MKDRRNYADAYAETLVMPEKMDALAMRDEKDPLALYEEYARELTDELAASVPPRSKR